jgi:hypothetical protein
MCFQNSSLSAILGGYDNVVLRKEVCRTPLVLISIMVSLKNVNNCPPIMVMECYIVKREYVSPMQTVQKCTGRKPAVSIPLGMA